MWKPAVLSVLVGAVAVAEGKPAVSVGTVQVTAGTYDTARARKVLAAAEPKVLGCYTSLVGVPRTGVVATAKLKLAANCKVSAVTVRGLASSETDPVHNCVADTLSKLRFAAPKAGEVVDLEAPFAFTGDLAGEVVELTRIGPDPGGAGPGWGTIGTGRYGTIGGGGSGYGVGAGGVQRTPASGPAVALGQATLKGPLDKAIVRRYVKRNVKKLQYCYEKELLATPGIEGALHADFTIAVDGTVKVAAATGLGNANVERCIAGVIQRIEFPKPKGAEVTVTFPITLKMLPPAKP